MQRHALTDHEWARLEPRHEGRAWDDHPRTTAPSSMPFSGFLRRELLGGTSLTGTDYGGRLRHASISMDGSPVASRIGCDRLWSAANIYPASP
jgi:hypothetical protein